MMSLWQDYQASVAGDAALVGRPLTVWERLACLRLALRRALNQKGR